MDGGAALVAVCALSCLLTFIITCRVRARRRPLPLLLDALSDPDPALRQAAIVIAARHGLRCYLDRLVDMTRSEESRVVRAALAEAVVDSEWKGADTERRSVELRAWGARYLSEPRPSRRQGARLPAVKDPGLGLVDALELMTTDMPTTGKGRRVPSRTGKIRAPRAGVWVAGLHEIDALEIIYAMRVTESARRALPSTPRVTLVSRPPLALPPPQDRDGFDVIIDTLVQESRSQVAAPLQEVTATAAAHR